MQAALMFAWVDDSAVLKNIVEMNTEDKIDEFLTSTLNVLFVVDQMNALDFSGNDHRSQKIFSVKMWLDKLMSQHKAVLGCSANYLTYIERQEKQTCESTMYVYRGLTKVRLSRIFKKK